MVVVEAEAVVEAMVGVVECSEVAKCSVWDNRKEVLL